MTLGRGGERRAALAGLWVAAALAAAACERFVTNLSGGAGPEAGLLRGKLPIEARGATHVARLTDGIAASPGDPWRTDLTAELSGADAFVTWDLGAAQPIRCALIDADGNDRYVLSLSNDGRAFAPVWTAAPDEDQGQQLRAGRDLAGTGRYLRLSAAGGDGRWSVSELGAWSECPTRWPPLALQKGTPDDEAARTKLWAFAVLAVAYVLAYRRGAPDWVKLLGALPAGVGVALAIQLAQVWPPSSGLVARVGAAVVAVAVAAALRRLLWRRSRPLEAPPTPSK